MRQKTNSKMAGVNLITPIIALNVNGSNATIKKAEIVRLDKCGWGDDPTTCCLHKTHIRFKDTNRLRRKKMEKYIPAKQRRAGMALLMLNKIDFKSKNITRNKEGTFYNDEKVNTIGSYNIYKRICT